MSFQDLIVNNRELVVPGDPDDSELVHLLEGNGSGVFTQMPIQGDAFSMMSAAGETEITIEEIRQWVIDLPSGVEP